MAAEFPEPTLRDILDEAILTFEDAAAITPEVVGGITDFEEAVEFYATCYDAARVAGSVAEIAGKRAMELMPDRFEAYPVPGGGTFKVRGGNVRKSYDSTRLVAVLAERITDTLGVRGILTEDGEVGTAGPVVEGIAKAVAEAVGALAPSFDGWRAGVAKQYGIKLDDYCEKSTTDRKPAIEGRDRT